MLGGKQYILNIMVFRRQVILQLGQDVVAESVVHERLQFQQQVSLEQHEVVHYSEPLLDVHFRIVETPFQ